MTQENFKPDTTAAWRAASPSLTVGAILVCVSAIIVREEPTLEKFVANFDLLATIYALSFFIVARISNRVFILA